MTTVRDNLIAAKALIATPEKWIKGNLTRSGCYCAVGALGVASSGKADAYRDIDVWALRAQLAAVGWDGPVTSFNDDRDTTHADVMALFARAINAEKEGAAISAISSQPTQEG